MMITFLHCYFHVSFKFIEHGKKYVLIRFVNT